jgi:hypothetical protein
MKSKTPFVDIHEALEMPQPPEVVTPTSGGTVPAAQWTAHTVLFIAMCVARCGGITFKRQNDANGYLSLFSFDIFGAILWTCSALRSATDMQPKKEYTIIELVDLIGELYRMELGALTPDEGKKPMWAQLPIIENPKDLTDGLKLLGKIKRDVELDPNKKPSDRMPWWQAPHNDIIGTESNFKFKSEQQREVGETLIHLFFQESHSKWDQGCGSLYTSVVMAPFLVSANNTNSDAEAFYKPPSGVRTYMDWWSYMNRFHEDAVQWILNDEPHFTPPSPKSPECKDTCNPVENLLTGTCQDHHVIFSPVKGVSVTPQTPEDQMVLWDGNGEPPTDAYVPEFQKDADGIIIKNGRPIIVNWMKIDPTGLPDLNLPDACKPPAPASCSNPCAPITNDLDGTCQDYYVVYSSVDGSVPTLQTQMVLWDGKSALPKPAYRPTFLQDAQGSPVINKANGRKVLDGWEEFDPASLPPIIIPDVCKTPGPCKDPCESVLDEATGNCGASKQYYVPDPPIDVAPTKDTPMKPWNIRFGTEDPPVVYYANAKKNPDGTLALDKDGKPILLDWTSVQMSMIARPVVPDACKKPDPDPSGGGGGGGGEGALALILLLVLALLFFSRRR